MADNDGNPVVAPSWWRRVIKWSGILISSLAIAADLTADLPIALPRWLSWLSGIPERAYDVVYLLGLLLAAYLFARERRGIRRLERQLEHEQRERRRLEEEAEQVVRIDVEPEPETEALRESIERLREVYAYCAEDLRLAREFLRDICSAAFIVAGDRRPYRLLQGSHSTERGGQRVTYRAGVKGSDILELTDEQAKEWGSARVEPLLDVSVKAVARDKGLIGRAIQDWIIAHCRDREESLTRRMSELAPGLSEAEFRVILQEFRETMVSNSGALMPWIAQGGVSILGEEELFRSPSYRKLYKQHVRSIEELRRAGERSDLGEIKTWVNTIDRLPSPKPPEGQQPPTAS